MKLLRGQEVEDYEFMKRLYDTVVAYLAGGEYHPVAELYKEILIYRLGNKALEVKQEK